MAGAGTLHPAPQRSGGAAAVANHRLRSGEVRIRIPGPDRWDPVSPHPVAVAVDGKDDRAVEEPIEHRRGDRRVVEDPAPGRDAQVRRERDRTAQVALADDLEERRGGLGRQGQVADLIDDQQPGSGVEAHRRRPAPLDRRPEAARRELGGGRVGGPIAGFDRGPSEGDREHRLADPGWADEQQVRRVLEKAQRPELVDERAIDRRLGVADGMGRSALRSARPATYDAPTRTARTHREAVPP